MNIESTPQKLIVTGAREKRRYNVVKIGNDRNRSTKFAGYQYKTPCGDWAVCFTCKQDDCRRR